MRVRNRYGELLRQWQTGSFSELSVRRRGEAGGAIISGSRRSVDFGIRLLPAHARKPFSIRVFGTVYAKAAAKASSGAIPKGGFILFNARIKAHTAIYRIRGVHGYSFSGRMFRHMYSVLNIN